MMKKVWLIGLLAGLFLTACGDMTLSQDTVQLSPTDIPLPEATPIELPTAVSIPPTIDEPQSVITLPSVDGVDIEPIDLIETVGTDEPVIVYSRSGGFAGLEQEWNIYADGRIENAEGKLVGQAEPAEVTAVVMLADEAGFYELDDEYLDKNVTCCDLITYTLTVTDGEQRKTIVTRDMSPHPPAFMVVKTAVEALIYDNAITE